MRIDWCIKLERVRVNDCKESKCRDLSERQDYREMDIIFRDGRDGCLIVYGRGIRMEVREIQ